MILRELDRHFLCLVGEKTHKSTWVAWEINKAIALKKKVIAVKIAKDNTTPSSLYGVGATWRSRSHLHRSRKLWMMHKLSLLLPIKS
jgi:hypothetical protein